MSWKVPAIIALVLLAAACNQQKTDVQKHVDKALSQANVGHVRVDWDDEARVAHLKGSVATPVDRVRAEQVATRAVGTSGMVVNEITVSGTDIVKEANHDGEIRERLNDLVQSDPAWRALRQRDINFEVNNGAVTITGGVATAREKAQVGKIVRGLPDVRDVANALQVMTVKPVKKKKR